MIAAGPLQQAIYTALNVASVTSLLTTQYAGVPAIFSDVPQASDSELPAFFPFIVIGGDTISPNNDKDKTGGNAIVQIDVFSRLTTFSEVKAIAAAVDLVIQRQPLTITGATWVTTELEGVDFDRDPDGLTKRAIMQYRVLYIKT
jgi:hypothetical protein